jgi:hypothetical protein
MKNYLLNLFFFNIYLLNCPCYRNLSTFFNLLGGISRIRVTCLFFITLGFLVESIVYQSEIDGVGLSNFHNICNRSLLFEDIIVKTILHTYTLGEYILCSCDSHFLCLASSAYIILT